jgi:hypothetical protein
MTGRVAALVVIAVLATPSEAGGQSRVGFSGYCVFGDIRMDAARTFEAVSETRHARVLGAGIQVADLWRFTFVDVAVWSMNMDGERVFIDEASVVPRLRVDHLPARSCPCGDSAEGRGCGRAREGHSTALADCAGKFEDPPGLAMTLVASPGVLLLLATTCHLVSSGLARRGS